MKKFLNILKIPFMIISFVVVFILEFLIVLLNPLYRLLSFIYRIIIHPKYDDIVSIKYTGFDIDVFSMGITIDNSINDSDIKIIDEVHFKKAIKELEQINFFRIPKYYTSFALLDIRDFFIVDGGVTKISCIITLKNGRIFRVDSDGIRVPKIEKYVKIISKYYDA